MRRLAVGALAVLAAGGLAYATSAHSGTAPLPGRIVLLASSSLHDELLDGHCRPIATFVTTRRVNFGSFVFSPRGFVAFTRQPVRERQVPYTEVVVRGLGRASPERVVARVPGYSEDFAFSADGRLLAVADGAGILLKSLRTGRSRLLPLPEARRPWLRGYSHLSFSSDGRLLAAEQASWQAGDVNIDKRHVETVVIPLAGGRLRGLYSEPHPLNYIPSPLFTSDGRGIVLVSDRHKQLVRFPLVIGRPIALTPPVTTRVFIDPYLVEPRGAGYIFGRGWIFPRKPTDVWRVDAAGRVTRLTHTPIQPPGSTIDERIPLALSPDGKRVLIAHLDRAEVIPLGGGHSRPVCRTRAPVTIEGGVWLR